MPKMADKPITSSAAALLSVSFTALYVLPFYLSPLTRPSPTLNRDDPSVIRARIRTVLLTCFFSTAVTVWLVARFEWPSVDASRILHLLGYAPTLEFGALLGPLLLTALLFLGPLYERFICSPRSIYELVIEFIPRLVRSLRSDTSFRTYLAGPVTEEILFRSVIIPLHLLCQTPPTRIIFYTPLYFGIAHLHHLYEFTLTHPSTPLLPAILRSLFQFGYTTLFGWYAAFLYLRTASLPVVILVHSFCNWCGLPRLWGSLERENFEPSPADRGRVSYSELPGWPTLLYYVCLMVGAAGWWSQLWFLTDSSRSLVDFGR